MIRKKILVLTSKEKIFQFAVITVGAVIASLALVLFMLPYKVAPGGVPGLAVIITTMTKFPAGITMLILNIPCFALGLWILGREFSAKTIYTAVSISVLTDFFNEILHLRITIHDPILAPIFGGVFFGVGVGLILKMGSATMGSGTIARILALKTNLKQGTAIFIINGVVIFAAGFTFRSADLALYGFLATYSSSVIVDMIVEGLEYARGAYIISDRAIEIADVILYEMQRGVTAFRGRGLYTHSDKDILFVIVTRKEIRDLTTIARKIDPAAFVIVTPVHEVLGQGFRRRI